MIDRAAAEALVDEYQALKRVRLSPSFAAMAVEMMNEKNALDRYYFRLYSALYFGSDDEVAAAYEQMHEKFLKLREKLTLIILGNGSI